MPPFCRHNRFAHNCPICRQPEAPPARARTRTPTPGSRPAARGGGVRVRRLARTTDDGYRNELVPGLKSSADAQRLVDELAFAAARLGELATDPPVAYADAALAEDREEALWLLFLIALAGETRTERVTWASGELPDLPGAEPTLTAYRAWAARAGSQAAGLAGDGGWTAQRRFARAYERLALPGLTRAARFEFLVTAGRLGLAELRADALHLGGDDATTLAAKRVFGIGDVLLLERRAAEVAAEAAVPVEALDLALFNWGQPTGGRATRGSRAEPSQDDRATIAAALGTG